MKLRQVPEDFIVEEIPDFTPDPRGRWFVYEVSKRSITTFDVMESLRKSLRLGERDVSSSGLKDKHAVATQLVCLTKPLPGNFTHPQFDAHFAGKSSKPLDALNVAGNRFRITARELNGHELEFIAQNAASLVEHGIPNYYDSQRFGGAAGPHEMPGRAIAAGNLEEALRLHLAVPRRKQSLKDKRIRREAAAHWGNWQKILDKLPPCRERQSIAHLLEHPGDWQGALLKVSRKLLQLYLAAWQSWLFNLTLREAVKRTVAADRLKPVKFKSADMPFWRELLASEQEALAGLKLPLLAGDTDFTSLDALSRECADAALAEASLTRESLKVEGLQGLRLHGATRDAMLMPKDFKLEGPLDDELNAERKKAVASFVLPRGCFATIVMKRLGL